MVERLLQKKGDVTGVQLQDPPPGSQARERSGITWRVRRVVGVQPPLVIS
jgi:hypothetical protein